MVYFVANVAPFWWRILVYFSWPFLVYFILPFTNEEWFEKKVVKKAKSQLKDTFSFYKNESNQIFSKSSELVLDRTKEVFPVIVFLNNNLEQYKRIIYSESLDMIINIFTTIITTTQNEISQKRKMPGFQ